MGHCNGIWAGKLLLQRKFKGLLAVAAAGGHPLTPFVVADQRGGDYEDSEDAEKSLHGHS